MTERTTKSTTENIAGREQLLTRALVSLADTLVDDYDVIDLLERLVGHSVELLNADAAGLMLADTEGQLHAVAASTETADFMELMQLQAQQGPCLDCYATGAPVSVGDLSTPDAARRWPRFVAIIHRREDYAYTSTHAIPLRLRRQTIGSLNLFSRTPGALPAADLALGQALADIATIGLLQERAIRRSELLVQQLQHALTSSRIIEQAKGALALRIGLSPEQALAMLRDYARPRQLRLAELARQVITGELGPTQLSAATAAQGSHTTSSPTKRMRRPHPPQ